MFEKRKRTVGWRDNLEQRLEGLGKEKLLYQLFYHLPYYINQKVTTLTNLDLDDDHSCQRAAWTLAENLKRIYQIFGHDLRRLIQKVMAECLSLLSEEQEWNQQIWHLYEVKKRRPEKYQGEVSQVVHQIYADIKARNQDIPEITDKDPLLLALLLVTESLIDLHQILARLHKEIMRQKRSLTPEQGERPFDCIEMLSSFQEEEEQSKQLQEALNEVYMSIRELLITHSLLEHEAAVFRRKGGPKLLLPKKHGHGLPVKSSHLRQNFRYFLIYEPYLSQEEEEEEESVIDTGFFSGDLYYHEELTYQDDRYLLLIHGDAQGHGTKASRLKYEVLRAIKISGTQNRFDKNVVRYLRRRLFDFVGNYAYQTKDLPQNKMFQLQWLFFDFANFQLYPFDFGHGMCFTINKDKSFSHIRSDASALITGLLRKQNYEEFIQNYPFPPTHLKEISKLVTFSDGILEEPRNWQEEASEQYMDHILQGDYSLKEGQNIYGLFFEKLLKKLQKKTHIHKLDCEEFSQAIMKDLYEFKDNTIFADDITLLVIETNPKLTRFYPKASRFHKR